MNAFTEFLANAQATSQLKPRYYWTTSVVGILVVAGGIGVMFVAAAGLAALLNVDLDAPVRDSTNGNLWSILFLLVIPLSIAVAMVPIAWICGLVLVRIGYMEQEDVKYYALRSRYPAHWFKEAANNPLNH